MRIKSTTSPSIPQSMSQKNALASLSMLTRAIWPTSFPEDQIPTTRHTFPLSDRASQKEEPTAYCTCKPVARKILMVARDSTWLFLMFGRMGWAILEPTPSHCASSRSSSPRPHPCRLRVSGGWIHFAFLSVLPKHTTGHCCE